MTSELAKEVKRAWSDTEDGAYQQAYFVANQKTYQEMWMKRYQHMLANELLNLEFNYALEIGCAYGPVTSFLADKFPSVKFFAIDISKWVITKAKEMNNRSNILYQHNDAEKILYEDNAFDLVYCCNVLSGTPDDAARKIFDEMYRVSNRYVVFGREWNPECASEKGLKWYEKCNAVFDHDFKSYFTEKGMDLKIIPLPEHPQGYHVNCIYIGEKK